MKTIPPSGLLVTDEHCALAARLTAGHWSLLDASRAIAESESRAVASAIAGITCTHHTDKQRAECPVCLVTALRVELATLQMLYKLEKQAKMERGDMLCECQDELVTERARLDWLESDDGKNFQWGTHLLLSRSTIDAAMKDAAP